MSGGPVFDRGGRVIGIHGRVEGGGLVRKSLGISIKTFLSLIDKLNINYDRAIAIEPKYAEAYANRGVSKAKIGDKQGSIADLNIAAEVFKNRNDIGSFDRAMNLVCQISNTP